MGSFIITHWGVYKNLPELMDYHWILRNTHRQKRLPSQEVWCKTFCTVQDQDILQRSVRNRLAKLFCYTLQSHLFLYLCWLLFNNFRYACKTANKEIFLSIEPKLGLQIVILSSYWEVKEIKFWSWTGTKSGAYNSPHTRCSSQNAQQWIYAKCV